MSFIHPNFWDDDDDDYKLAEKGFNALAWFIPGLLLVFFLITFSLY